MRNTLKFLAMAGALVVIWIVFQSLTDGAFLQPRNISNLLRQMSVTGVLAAGMTLVIVAGHVDLSVGSGVALLGVWLALLNTQLGVSVPLVVVLTLVAGGLLGFLQGWLVAVQKIPAFIVTLGGMMVFRGAAIGLSSGATMSLLDNGLGRFASQMLPIAWGWGAVLVGSVFAFWRVMRLRNSSKGSPKSSMQRLVFWAWATAGAIAIYAYLGSYQGLPIPVLILFAVIALMDLLARRTPMGRHVFAIGGGLEAARLSGVRVTRTVLGVFVSMGLLSAVAALILTSRVGSASPDAGSLLELDAIAACVIGGTSLMGGRGSVWGAILGALVMESLNNGMSLANVEAFWQLVIKGLVLVGAVWVDTYSQSRK